MQRRIFGLETEYGMISSSPDGRVSLSVESALGYLFEKVVARQRGTNDFLCNGGRLYQDTGCHPEYATPECDDPLDLALYDKAGERIVEELRLTAEQKLRDNGIDCDIFLFKNNTDSGGNSYGCHENFLIRRRADYLDQIEALLPFLITRQLICGAGKVLSTPRGTIYALSQRADHMWEGVSSATTRSRPIINTRDEPHADAESFRRLHVIVGDSNMCELTTMVKVASMDLVLRALEANALRKNLTLENPIRAIRDVSHDLTGQAMVTLSSGQTMTALNLQTEFLTMVKDYIEKSDSELSATHGQALELWERTLNAVETGNHGLIDRDIDWAIKKRLITAYQERHNLELDSARIAQVDLMYHDVSRSRGLFNMMERTGAVNRISTDIEVFAAKSIPPQNTRAKLRGDFIKAAQIAGKDISVDWVHLKMNDQTQRTVLCKDPFANVDERVEKLIESMDDVELKNA